MSQQLSIIQIQLMYIYEAWLKQLQFDLNNSKLLKKIFGIWTSLGITQLSG